MIQKLFILSVLLLLGPGANAIQKKGMANQKVALNVHAHSSVSK